MQVPGPGSAWPISITQKRQNVPWAAAQIIKTKSDQWVKIRQQMVSILMYFEQESYFFVCFEQFWFIYFFYR